ncbi:Phosphate transport system permease protein PstC (TC 3.A.1.7.1) [Alloactinosynnema sp. L-07]|uniref:phosphate ABC transporter permease subunit PstC n=1 Tax=Alloactinosynnema sp. L-07 TaxID=1653480 RepID=UPI00065EF8FE|nr:phosphate ABC transporter permease subunit PstC [Alloactinosynnema sp. L-07]CRK62092.1 Phosphate transport system permease protein PstC (TC 3.A.1.7.1) [Alloactinosynnema sp. L-07]
MSQVIVAPDAVGVPPHGDGPRRRVRPSGGADRVFRIGLRLAGGSVLLIMATVGLFLATNGADAFAKGGWSFFTTQAWEPDSINFGIAAVLIGTLLIAAVALAVAFPLALATALFISEYAKGKVKAFATTMIDGMAAVPSVVFGLVGANYLQWEGADIPKWLSIQFGWIPFLSVDGADPDNPLASDSVYATSTFWAGLVVGFMVMPFICSVMREAFSQAPAGEREGAFALGATKWGMIRSVVLPFGRSGAIGGTMLGLGRALGETIAVAMIIPVIFRIQPHILEKGGSSVSALIAQKWGAASPFGLSALMAAGLTLFALTLVVNFGASAIIARSRSGQGSD